MENQEVFTITGSSGIVLDSIKINQKTNKDAISIKSYSQNILVKNTTINAQSGDGIETYGNNGKF